MVELSCLYCNTKLTPENSSNYDPRDVRAKHYGVENNKESSLCLEARQQAIAHYLGKPIDYAAFQLIYNALYIEQNSNEFWWLLQKVQSLSPKTILEIGVKHGGSLLFWSEIAGMNGFVVGVEQNGGLKPTLDRTLSLIDDRYTAVLYGDSTDSETIRNVLMILAGNSVDFLFIDGDHRNGVPRKDFDNYSQLVRNGGMVCLADLNAFEGHEPQQVLDSLVGRKETDPTGTMGIWYKQ